MTPTAIISDIHANLEALEAVLGDIRWRGVGSILCLGDIVGDGPNPMECIELVQRHCELVLRGNYEEGVLQGIIGFPRRARATVDWTRGILSSRPDLRDYLQSLPSSARRGDHLLVHGSPIDPISGYLFPGTSEDSFAECFRQFKAACFVGHTHSAGVFRQTPAGTVYQAQRDLSDSVDLSASRAIVNVGSVGQPRDGDPRACYVSIDSASNCRFHRIPYDVEAVQRKLEEMR